MSLARIAAALLLESLMAGNSTPYPASRPVMIDAQQVGDEVRISVIGRSVAPVQVRYRLETDSGKAAGSSRSAQQGGAILDEGRVQRLVGVTLRGVAHDWRATLKVTVDEKYEYDLDAAGGGDSE